MEERTHLAWTAARTLSQYRRDAAEMPAVLAAARTVNAIRHYLAMRDDTTFHPGARRLAVWLHEAKAAGRAWDAEEFERRLAEFLRPRHAN